MQIGERLKKVREFRKITQKELGLALGYPIKSAGVRIAQYESCAISPKLETAKEMAKVLRCNFQNLHIGDVPNAASRIMFDMFWLEEIAGFSLYVFQLEKYEDEDDRRIVHGKVNCDKFWGVYPPVALAFNYPLINDFMREWAIRFKEFSNGEITLGEYFEWKINWPYTCDDGGRIEPTIKWRKA